MSNVLIIVAAIFGGMIGYSIKAYDCRVGIQIDPPAHGWLEDEPK